MRSVFHISLGFACALAVSIPGWAGNESRYEAFPISNDVFEVVADFTENSIYWCGAATYARVELGARGTQRLFVWERPGASLGKPGEKAVQFSFREPAGADSGVRYSNAVDILGNSMSVTQALQTCTERSASG